MGKNGSMKLETINQLAHKDMLAVNGLIQQQVDSEVSLINQLGFYIVNSGGKRLRPLLTVLAARALIFKQISIIPWPLSSSLFTLPPYFTMT